MYLLDRIAGPYLQLRFVRERDLDLYNRQEEGRKSNGLDPNTDQRGKPMDPLALAVNPEAELWAGEGKDVLDGLPDLPPIFYDLAERYSRLCKLIEMPNRVIRAMKGLIQPLNPSLRNTRQQRAASTGIMDQSVQPAQFVTPARRARKGPKTAFAVRRSLLFALWRRHMVQARRAYRALAEAQAAQQRRLITAARERRRVIAARKRRHARAAIKRAHIMAARNRRPALRQLTAQRSSRPIACREHDMLQRSAKSMKGWQSKNADEQCADSVGLKPHSGQPIVDDSAYVSKDMSQASSAEMVGCRNTPQHSCDYSLLSQASAASSQQVAKSGNGNGNSCPPAPPPSAPHNREASITGETWVSTIPLSSESDISSSSYFGSGHRSSSTNESQSGIHSNKLKMELDDSTLASRGLPGSESWSAARVEEAAVAAPVPDDGPAPEQASKQFSHVADVADAGPAAAANNQAAVNHEAAMHQQYDSPQPQLASALPMEVLSTIYTIPESLLRRECKLGKGAFGEVWRCNNLSFGPIAVKTTLPGAPLEDFCREALSMAYHNHPNLVRIFGVVQKDVPAGSMGRAGSAPVIGLATEIVRGKALSRELKGLKEAGQLLMPMRLRAEFGLDAARGLGYMHSLGFVHLDIKPDNLLLDGSLHTLDGKYPTPTLKVADFGLARQAVGGQPLYLNGGGTELYMSPEMASVTMRAITDRADVYSLGVVLLEMFTLKAEWCPGRAMTELRAGRVPDIPATCEPEWAFLLSKCLQPDPEQRWPMYLIASYLELLIQTLDAQDQELKAAAAPLEAAAKTEAAAKADAEA